MSVDIAFPFFLKYFLSFYPSRFSFYININRELDIPTVGVEDFTQMFIQVHPYPFFPFFSLLDILCDIIWSSGFSFEVMTGCTAIIR